jgi:small subunit ribosomal protein S8
MTNDPIADMLTRIRNGIAVQKESVSVPHSKLKLEIAKILRREGYLEDFIKKGKKTRKQIELFMKQTEDGEYAIQGLTRVSKPGRRVYTNTTGLRAVRSGVGKSIVSTPEGLMTNTEAKKKHLGGEILFEVW